MKFSLFLQSNQKSIPNLSEDHLREQITCSVTKEIATTKNVKTL